MSKLKVLENTELSEYCLNVLQHHNIRFVKDFINEKPDKLMKIMNLSQVQFSKILNELKRLYGPKSKSLFKRYQENETQRLWYKCKISSLDDILLEETLNNQSIWEICGVTGVGKTQLALSILVNFVIHQNLPALYIDTKLDFSAERVINILKNSLEIDSELYPNIMQAIKVERVLQAQQVVELLENIYNELAKGNLQEVANIKLIVIDSLPSVWFLLKAATNRLAGKWLLSRLAQIVHRLAQEFYIAVVMINLSLMPSEELNTDPKQSKDYNEVIDIIEEDERIHNENGRNKLKYEPVLGHFWLTKPPIRLSIEKPAIQTATSASERIIRVLKGPYNTMNKLCSVNLLSKGVV